MKRRGPSTEPWGTPWVAGDVTDWELFMETKWCLSVRYDLNQVRAVSVIPRDLRREMSMEWWMVSKAALRSSRMRMLSEPVSEESRRSFVTLRRAVSVLCLVRNPD